LQQLDGDGTANIYGSNDSAGVWDGIPYLHLDGDEDRTQIEPR